MFVLQMSLDTKKYMFSQAVKTQCDIYSVYVTLGFTTIHCVPAYSNIKVVIASKYIQQHWNNVHIIRNIILQFFLSVYISSHAVKLRRLSSLQIGEDNSRAR